MQPHPLVSKIRFWLWMTGLAVISCLWPAYGMFAIGAGFGWWKGCGCCAVTHCSGCTGDLPTSIQVVVTGCANGTCSSCSSWNNTYTLPSIGTCSWYIDIPGFCICGGTQNFCNLTGTCQSVAVQISGTTVSIFLAYNPLQCSGTVFNGLGNYTESAGYACILTNFSQAITDGSGVCVSCSASVTGIA